MVYAGYLMMHVTSDKKGWDESPTRATLRQLMDAVLYFGSTPPKYDFGRPSHIKQ
jgi:hypothetical protein